LKKFDTVKLFYDEYPYKLVVRNSLSHIFRDKNLPNAKKEIDKLQDLLVKGKPLTRTAFQRSESIELQTFLEVQKLYIEFNQFLDYKLRIQNPLMTIYSHNYEWLINLTRKVKNCIEIWEPDSRFELKPNAILIDKPSEFEYKVTLGLEVDPGLATWITANPDKAKAGATCLKEIANKGYTRDFYIYIRDEKILQLLSLFVTNIARVDKLVYIAKTDK
tara:strand:- start:730 stop:1383 length:654 start_codon:yes stop_codon:yes gene_type:complete